MTDYKELLTELQNFTAETSIEMYVPTRGEHVKFRALTVKQQTDIITGVMSAQTDRNVYQYQNVVDKILMDNIFPEQDVTLYNIDRICLLVQLRHHTTGETIEISGEEYDLNNHIKHFPEHVIDVENLRETLEHQGIAVTCSVPTLAHEHDVNSIVPQVFKDTTSDKSISDIFLIELSKYIEMVKFDNNTIVYDDLTLEQKIQICELLPMSLSQKIVKYIETVKSYEQPFAKITTDTKQVDIPIDSQLFDG